MRDLFQLFSRVAAAKRPYFDPYRTKRLKNSYIPWAIGHKDCPAFLYRETKPRQVAQRMVAFETVLEGEMILMSQGNVYRVPAGDSFLLVRPSDTVYYANPSTPSGRVKTLWMSLANEYLSFFVSQSTGLTCHVFPKMTGAEEKSFVELFSLAHASRASRFQECFLLSHAWWGRLVDTIMKQKEAPTEKSTPAGTGVFGLEKKPDEPRRIGEAARDMGISREHFSRQFRKRYGVSPKQYLMKRRLGTLAELLQSSDKSIDELTLEIGFSGSSHAALFFKREFGMSMSAWRTKYGHKKNHI